MNNIKFFLNVFLLFILTNLYGESKSNSINNISSSVLSKVNIQQIELEHCRFSYDYYMHGTQCNIILANKDLNLQSNKIIQNKKLECLYFVLCEREIKEQENFEYTGDTLFGYLMINNKKYCLNIKQIEPIKISNGEIYINAIAIIADETGVFNSEDKIKIYYNGKISKWDYEDLWNSKRLTLEEIDILKKRLRQREKISKEKLKQVKNNDYNFIMMLTEDIELGNDYQSVYLISVKNNSQIIFLFDDNSDKYFPNDLLYSIKYAFATWGSDRPFSFLNWSESIVNASTKFAEKKEEVFDSIFNRKLIKYYVKYENVYSFFHK